MMPLSSQRSSRRVPRKPLPAAAEIDFSKLVTITDIAEIFSVTPQTVRKYRDKDPEFPETSYVKKTHWWSRDDILAYQERRAAHP